MSQSPHADFVVPHPWKKDPTNCPEYVQIYSLFRRQYDINVVVNRGHTQITLGRTLKST